MYFPTIGALAKSDVRDRQTPPARGTETILLVDDEELIRDLGKRFLAGAGYQVLTANSGKDALEIYAKQNPSIDLVILDLIMPEMGGSQCLSELLRIDPEVKALIGSGFAVDDETKEFLNTSAIGMVTKPYTMRGLLQSVRQALDEN